MDYEEGLQKVFYRDNLIVRMYAMADWFSPADIEAPTLEEIQFFDRQTGKPVELEAEFEVAIKHDTKMATVHNPSSVSRGLMEAAITSAPSTMKGQRSSSRTAA